MKMLIKLIKKNSLCLCINQNEIKETTQCCGVILNSIYQKKIKENF